MAKERREKTPAERDDGPLVTTTVRITVAQRDALRRAALARVEGGAGRPDASEIVRELLDAWIARGTR